MTHTPLTLVTVPCLQDNYAFLIHNEATGTTALIDAPEAAPIQAALETRGWRLSDILITHHHDDHVMGLAALRARTRVIGAAADVHRLPPLDLSVEPGDRFDVCGEEVLVMNVPGHTIGHVAFYLAGSALAFTGDSLMAMGCGRLFEGSPSQMWDSMQALRALPPETTICSGHEYTASNARFALSIDPGNAALQARAEDIRLARERGEATVPSRLSDEIATNPFLRADAPELAEAMGLAGHPAVQVFAAIRKAKDGF